MSPVRQGRVSAPKLPLMPVSSAAATAPTLELDDFDRHILHRLQQDCQQSAERIGAEVGLSASAVQRRIKRLRAQGGIQSEVAVLNPALASPSVTLVVGLEFGHDNYPALAAMRQRVTQDVAVQQMYYVTGQSDLVAIVHARDMPAYDAWCAQLMRDVPQIRRITTQVVIEALKRGLVVPVAS